MKLNNYNDLSSFFKIHKPHIFFVDKSKSNKDYIKCIIGFYLLGYNLNAGYKNFSPNRYFIEAINIKILPDLKLIKNEIPYLCKTFNLPNKEIYLKKKILKKLDKTLLEFKKDKVPKIFKKYKRNITKREFLFFNKNGYLIIENAFSLKLADKVKKKCLDIAKKEKANKTAFFYGSGKFQRVYHLIKKGKIFQELIFHPSIIDLCDYFFERPTLHQKYLLSSWHANILSPGAMEQKIHIDSAVPDPIPPWPIRLNVNFILQDYSESNGSTYFVPGSHKFLQKPNPYKKTSNLKPLIAKKGSLVFWTGHLWHQSGKNNSDEDRLALLGCFATSIFREMVMEENPYLSLKPDTASPYSKKIKNLIGWSHGLKEIKK